MTFAPQPWRGFSEHIGTSRNILWCPGPDSNRQAVRRRIFFTLHLSMPAAKPVKTELRSVRALDYAFAIASCRASRGATERIRRPPSSLYTFREPAPP